MVLTLCDASSNLTVASGVEQDFSVDWTEKQNVDCWMTD